MSTADELSRGSFPLCTKGIVGQISLLTSEQLGIESSASKRGLSEVERSKGLLVFSDGVLIL